jgi:flagellar hook-basal body complex protein FliE
MGAQITPANLPNIGTGGGIGNLNQTINEGPPFQQFLDNAVSSLTEISEQEVATDTLINNYIAGDASIEEVILATNKLSLAIQLAVTVVNTTVQTFKEIQQMPV